MTIKMFFAAAATLALLGAAPAHAQKAASDKPAAAAKAKPERTAKSLDCSKQADAKSLHGKPRKKFMSQCKRA
jgi:invasion protein IalB